jgi:hypothetical protein
MYELFRTYQLRSWGKGESRKNCLFWDGSKLDVWNIAEAQQQIVSLQILFIFVHGELRCHDRGHVPENVQQFLCTLLP